MPVPIEPKPCPKCGATPTVITTWTETVYVGCTCGLETTGCRTREEAIALWNRGEYEDL